MKLSDRLETIVSFVPEEVQNGRVADIGTDHGFVPIRLVELNKVSGALAMDVRKGPLERAKEHIAQYGMEQKIETRLSDGLQALQPGEAQAVVIAGMGGELMLRILRDGEHVRDSIDCWILSPQSELSVFRHGLEELGLAILREVMVEEDGKYYTIMEVRPGVMHYDRESGYRYGECLMADRSPVLKEFLEKEQRQYEMILKQLEAQRGQGALQRSREIQGELELIKEAYDAMQ